MKKNIQNELMLGCWVKYQGEPIKITGITQDFVSFDTSTDTQVALAEKLEPIKITKELLERNGFTRDETTSRMFWDAYDSPDGKIHMRKVSNKADRQWNIHIDNDDCDTIASADVEYVHQMQIELMNQDVILEIKP